MRGPIDMRLPTAVLIALSAVLLLLNASPGHARNDNSEDSVQVLGGAAVTGSIRELHPTHVLVERRGKTERIERPKIERIRWAGEPAELTAARNAVQRGNWPDARTQIDTLQAGDLAALSAAIRSEIQYLDSVVDVEQTLAGRGDPESSRGKLFEFGKQNRDSIFFYPAVELLAELEWARGDGAAAIRFWEQYQKAPWPEFQVKAISRQARIHYAMQQFEEALKSWRSLGAIKDITPSQRALSDAGTALCQMATGKSASTAADNAVGTIERLIRDTEPDRETELSGIYLCLGYAHLRNSQPTEALLAFLHVDALYESEKSDQAEALAQLVPLWEQQGRQDRSRDAAARLQDRYGGTYWGRSHRSESPATSSGR